MMRRCAPSRGRQGMILAYGAGVYIQIAASECMPSMRNEATSVRLRVAGLVAFVVGCVAIGLVLLDHEHCIPTAADGAAADPHAGHNHGR